MLDATQDLLDLDFSTEAMRSESKLGRLHRAGTRYEVRLYGGTGKRIWTASTRDAAEAVAGGTRGARVVEVVR